MRLITVLLLILTITGCMRGLNPSKEINAITATGCEVDSVIIVKGETERLEVRCKATRTNLSNL